MRMYVNDRVQRDQSLCVSVRVKLSLAETVTATRQMERKAAIEKNSLDKYTIYCNNFSILNREVGEREGVFLWTWWGNVYSTVTCPVSTSICLKNLSIESLLAPGLLLFNSPCALMFLSKGPNKIGKSPHGISK